MQRHTTRIILVTAILWFGATARAGQVLPTPPRLSPGDTFRFVVVTQGTRTATSSSIANYNTFVNAQAGAATYGGSVVTWEAIGSTSSTSAINNVGQTTTPVYLPDGTLVTTSTTSAGLWSGSLLHRIDEDISGMGLHTGSTGVWTGTNTNGSKSANPLGNFFGVETGNTLSTNGTWVNNGAFSSTTSGVFHMYGISQVLTAVPEPSSFVMAGTAIIAISMFGWSRKSGDQRRHRPD
jgi:hypothetical protein